MRPFFSAIFAFAILVLSTISFSIAPVHAGSWPGMITDAGTNPAYRASTVNEPWTECGPRLWNRSLTLHMTADQAIKTMGFGSACGYEGWRGGTDKGSDGNSPGIR